MALTPYVPSSTWLARPRSAEPYLNNWLPSGYPPNPRLCLDDFAHEYLSGLWQAAHERRLSQDLIINDWIYNCPELDLTYGNPLTREDLELAFESIIASVNHARLGQIDTSHVLLQDLESAMQHDRDGKYNFGRQITFEAQHLFRALSYVSNRCRSVALGGVLHIFFTRHVRWIHQHNSLKALWQWCLAILESGMTDTMKSDCITQLYFHQPDLESPTELRKAEGSVRRLTQLAREISDLLDEGCRPRRHRSLRRRHSRSRVRLLSRRRSPSWLSDDVKLRDRDQVKDEVRFHERALERKQRELESMGSDDEHRYGTRRPRSYRQRRPSLENAWSNMKWWSDDE